MTKKRTLSDIVISILTFPFALIFPAIFAAILNYIGNGILMYIWGVKVGYLVWFGISCVIAFCFYIYSKVDDFRMNYEVKIREFQRDFEKKESILKSEYNQKFIELENYRKELEKSRSQMERLMSSSTPFTLSAQLFADMKACIFESTANYLKNKKNPAKGTAAVIKGEFQRRVKIAEAKYNEMLYKYEFLLETFPELRPYVEDEEDLLSLSKVKSYEELEEKRDRSKDYLSQEEWNALSTTDRNQLALDRWMTSNRSNHMIGMMYEMYISSKLREQGYTVMEYGIKHGLSDLGRDIIARKGNTTYIIQCKNWSKKKLIHENVVNQLKGTSLEYEIQHPTEKVIPVLICTTNLSDTAMEFAKRLDIIVKISPMGAFPMIKCNVNAGEKIYHLPFDQQYERTEITKVGECYAWTVQEAEDKGFRRAKRHIIS